MTGPCSGIHFTWSQRCESAPLSTTVCFFSYPVFLDTISHPFLVSTDPYVIHTSKLVSLLINVFDVNISDRGSGVACHGGCRCLSGGEVNIDGAI